MKTIGDHIRKRRFDLCLTQVELANILNVNEMTIVNWEKGITTPRLYLLPKIIEFLDHNPVQGNATSLEEKIKKYRTQNGLSLRMLAKKLCIDPGTLAKWEKGRNKPMKRFIGKLDTILGNIRG